MSKLITDIKKKLSDNGKSQKTIDIYIGRLTKLNEGKPPTNLKFLRSAKKTKEYFKSINLSPVSQKSYLGTINTILNMYPLKSNIKAVEKYQNFFTQEEKEQLNKPDEKSQKQEDNWISWDDVLQVKKDLYEKAKKAFQSDNVSRSQYNDLLNNLILSFYTNIPPRRSKDYAIMKIEQPDGIEDDQYNYLTLYNSLVFFNYKTHNKYGKQVIDISGNESLIEDLNMFLAHRKENEANFLLTKFSGKELNPVNDITRVLNSIFKKNISVNILRVIYVTNKYSDTKKNMESDSQAMAHSVNTQQTVYNKK
jgi:hypothetical protein